MPSTARHVWAAVMALLSLLRRFPILLGVCMIAKIMLMLLPDKWTLQYFPRLKLAANLNISHKTALQNLRVRYIRYLCPLKIGLQAPNINVIGLDRIQKKLLDFQRAGRPLVVNFGSCT